MRWQDRVSSEEVAKRRGLKEIQKSETQEKIAMVRTCEKRDRRQRVLRRIEEMEVPVRRQVGRPRRTWRNSASRLGSHRNRGRISTFEHNGGGSSQVRPQEWEKMDYKQSRFHLFLLNPWIRGIDGCSMRQVCQCCSTQTLMTGQPWLTKSSPG